MTWPEILTFTVVASLLVMSPGPNGVLIAKTVPISGRGAGFANVAGFVTAFYLHGAMVLLFSRLTAVTRNDNFQRWLKGVTGFVFLGFGLKLASYKPDL